MQNTLIIKLNATGDVVRTTPVLRKLLGHVTWITARNNVSLLAGVAPSLRVLSWDERADALDRDYDLLMNLEDETETARYAASVRHARLFGAFEDAEGRMSYTDDASPWFDLSLISRHGRRRADELKLLNRHSYQHLVFAGLGWQFGGERYLLPRPSDTGLAGDVALAPVAGPAWPMKNWAHYDELRAALEARGHRVNVLPRRATLTEHLGDVAGHRCLVSGDSLPMHLALGIGIPCVTIFNCTSPWEIHDYGLQRQVISPRLAEFFYRRDFDSEATRAISMSQVLDECLRSLRSS